jgi:hypothetical protein
LRAYIRLVGRDGADGMPENRDAEEENTQHAAEDQEGGRGIARFRRLEDRHAVGDRLHSRHGRAATGECAENQEEGDTLTGMDGTRRRVSDTAGDDMHDTPHHDQSERADEDVGRKDEQSAGLAQAPQVGCHEQDDTGDVEQYAVRIQTRCERDDSLDTRGNGYCHRREVIHHQRGSGG